MSRHDPASGLRLLRHATALSHAARTVALDLVAHDGRTHRIAFVCVGAAANPCQLRTWLATAPTGDLRRFAKSVARLEVHGLVDLGGGLYERRAGDATEAWFTTELEADAVATLVPSEHPEEASIEVRLLPDRMLDVTTVCVTVARSAPGRTLASSASRLLTLCLTHELIAAASTGFVRNEVS
jgi:hypothetical protein